MSELFAAFGLDWRLLLIQAFNFAILLAVLWRFLYTPVLKMLDERREKVAEGVKNAEEAARRLAAAQGEGEKIVSHAARSAEGLVSEARTRAEDKRTQIVHAAEERATEILEEARERAEEARRQAITASEREIAKVAILAAEKVMREKLS